MFYHNIYSLPDGAPPESVIENDVYLDKWIKKYNLEKKQERMGKGDRMKSAKHHKTVISFNKGEE